MLKAFLYDVAGCRPDVDERLDHRGGRRRDPGAGRRRARDLRAVRRGRLRGRGRDRAQGDRRPAHVRVRRHRPAAPGRGRAGGGDVPPPVPRRPRAREGGRPVPRRARTTSSSPSASARSSARRSSGCSRRSRATTTTPRFLVQGTLYPDIVESGGGDNAVIKSHHNVGGLPDDMNFELVEPLRHLFKDEVRAVGEELGLPEEIVWRQPFPGPGLGVRIIGTITPERVEILQARRRDRGRGDPARRPVPRDLAELRGAARGADRRRAGRRPHLRVPDHPPRGHERRRDDRRLGPHARTTCSSASRRG